MSLNRDIYMKSGTQKNWIADLRQRITSIHTAMFTTCNGQSMHSRPMLSLEMDENGELWFFASVHSKIVHDINKGATVNITYSDPADQVFVSITGLARITYDKRRIDKLWKPVFRTWFEKGKEDASLILLNIKIHHAEYWDASEYKMRNMFNLVGSFITGESMQVTSEHNKIELN